MKVTIPRFTVGTDIETKDTVASAYILSIASVMFDNYTLKPVSILNVTFNPNDPEQGNRTSSDRTLDWWAGNDASSPCKLAHELTWNGTLGFRAGMEEVDKYFRSLPYGKFTMPMKGPDFDYVIIKHALRELGMYRTPLHATPLDSVRTVERLSQGLELPPISDLELKRFWKSDTKLPHTAVYDAAIEGYETARLYHCVHLIKTVGYQAMMAELDKWATVPDSVIPISE